jgi:hypothetical protein
VNEIIEAVKARRARFAVPKALESCSRERGDMKMLSNYFKQGY